MLRVFYLNFAPGCLDLPSKHRPAFAEGYGGQARLRQGFRLRQDFDGQDGAAGNLDRITP
jgi:hypothetical protein